MEVVRKLKFPNNSNRVFPAMIGLSLALHGFVFFGWAWSKPSVPLPEPESQPLTKVKLTRMVTAPPQSVPVPVQQQEQKVIEKKPVETPPEPVPQQEAETIAEVQAGDENITQEAEEGEGEGEIIASPEYSETDDNREYEELLVYISGLIRQNLLYPQMARRRNIEGVVGVHFEIGIDGGLVSVRANHSSGSSILDKAAVSLIERICPIKNGSIRKRMALNINIAYELTD
jgi:protein TonB